MRCPTWLLCSRHHERGTECLLRSYCTLTLLYSRPMNPKNIMFQKGVCVIIHIVPIPKETNSHEAMHRLVWLPFVLPAAFAERQQQEVAPPPVNPSSGAGGAIRLPPTLPRPAPLPVRPPPPLPPPKTPAPPRPPRRLRVHDTPRGDDDNSAAQNLQAAGEAAVAGDWRECADRYLAAYLRCQESWPSWYITWSGYTSVLREVCRAASERTATRGRSTPSEPGVAHRLHACSATYVCL